MSKLSCVCTFNGCPGWEFLESKTTPYLSEHGVLEVTPEIADPKDTCDSSHLRFTSITSSEMLPSTSFFS